MSTLLRTEQRAAGGLLLGSLLILVLAAILMVVSGAIAGFRPIIQGSLAAVAPYVATFRLLITLFIIGWIIQLLGLRMFTRLMAKAGEDQLALVAFSLILVAVVLAILYSSFRMSVELWATQQAARVGALPTLYEPLRSWSSDIFRFAYRMHFVAMLMLGWGILRSRLLSPTLGWATIGWSGLCLIGALLGMGVPALPFLMPAAIGVALLVGGRHGQPGTLGEVDSDNGK
jgi:hypothetical protein